MAITGKATGAVSALQITILEQAADESGVAAGNPKLRRMSALEVRRLLRKELIGKPELIAAWKAWDDDWHERERTYAAGHFRAFERGEKGGWL